MTLPPIFVVSLARSVERREHVTVQLAAQRLPYEVHPAVDARDLTKQIIRERMGDGPLRPQPFLGRRLTMGEIACGLSHLELYRRIERDRLLGAVILEDDVDLLPGFGAVLRALAVDPRFDMVMLGHHSARHGYDVGAETCLRRRTVHGAHRVARVCEFAMGAYGYFVGAGAAARLARHAEPMRMPADWVTGYAPSAGVRQHAITPPCVVPARRFCAESEIGSRDGGKAPSVGNGTARRLGGKVFLAARKLGFFPGLYGKGF
jgi:glycosyl transferase family 25